MAFFKFVLNILVIFSISVISSVHSLNVSLSAPGDVCIFPLPIGAQIVDTDILIGSYEVKSDCLHLVRTPDFPGADTLNITAPSSNVSRAKSTVLSIEYVTPESGEVFLVSPYFGQLSGTSKWSVKFLESLIISNRSGIGLYVGEDDSFANPFTLSFDPDSTSWSVEVSHPELVPCGRELRFNILAVDMQIYKIVESAQVVVASEESYCRNFWVWQERVKRQVASETTPSEVTMSLKLSSKEGEFVGVNLKRELGMQSSGRTYSYMWSPADGELYVDGTSGLLMSKNKLDYESHKMIWTSLQVFVKDAAGNVLLEKRNVNVTIAVEDVNDTPPLVLNPKPLMASAYPTDSLSVGDNIYTLRVQDPDTAGNQPRQWSITATSVSSRNLLEDFCTHTPCSYATEYFGFGVSLSSTNGNSGTGGFYYPSSRSPGRVEEIPIVVRKLPIPPNAEFIMPIRLEDEVGNAQEVQLSIKTSPIPPQFQKTDYTIEVPESTKVGTMIGSVVAESFSDATVVYAMTVLAGSNKMFSIDPYKGSLTLNQQVDYDIARDDPSSREFKLRVTASESKIGGLSTSVPVSVIVTDSNDCAPSFKIPLYIVTDLSELAPIGQSVLTAEATDCDSTWPNNQVTISSNDARFFFDNATSTLKVASDLDYDGGRNNFEFTLVATDGGQPPLTGTAHVKVKLVNKPDEAPVFINTEKDGGYYEKVSESITGETIVAKIDAVDPDGLSPVRFFFEPTTQFQNPFYINEETGIVKKSNGAQLSQSEYKLTVRAVDDVTAARGDEKKEAFVSLTVEVIEENNDKPTFKDCEKIREVSESAQVGSVVFTVEAEDDDNGRYGQVKYGLVALLATSNSQPEFQIRQKAVSDQQSGKIRMIGEVILLRKVSRDEGDFRFLTINATDTYNPRDDTLLPTNLNVGVCTVTVKIIDANDKSPVFASPNYEVDIPSNKKVGEPIIRVVAYDNDLGENGKIYYKLIDPSKSGNFEINSLTGDISVKSSTLARERIDKSFNLIVTATDKGVPPRSTNVTVVIKVLANSDVKPPVFTMSDSNISVPENHVVGTAPGKEIGVFQALSSDRNEAVLITLQTGTTIDTNKDKTFAIPATGDAQHKLYVVKPIDYEKVKRYYLTVKAALSSNQNIYTLKQVTIEVTDVNDEVPEFVTPDGTFFGTVKEDDPTGTYVATVRAEDMDLGLGGKVAYSLPSFGVEYSYFKIDDNSGVVTLAKPLSNLDPPRSAFHLSVQARDKAPSSNPGTQGPNVNSVYVAILVIDVNDHPPKFDQDVYYANVRETTPIGEVILGVTATDEDDVLDQSLTYRIERGNVGGAFEINHDSGIIKLVRKLDFDFGQQMYNLTVLASDGKLSGRAYVIINVIDENDEPPKFSRDLYEAVVVENDTALIGTTIIKVQAIDQDLYLNPPGQVRYVLSGDGANDQFSISEVSGDVKLRKLLDREQRSVWNLLVLAEDVSPSVVPGTNQMASAEISLKVRDVNDNPPYFILPDKRGTIPENRPPNSLVMKMPAQDADENAEITYAIIGGATDLFEIDPQTAAITTKAELDREGDRGFEFQLVVQATDEDGFSTTGTAFVEVSDVNDNRPSCERASYVISVSEGAISGQSVFIFNIEDKDSHAVNGENTVSISEGNINTVFDITNPAGGIVNLLISSLDNRGIIDYESDQKTYNLTIEVSDPEFNPSPPSKCQIDVTVLDYNDNAPVFDPSSVDAVDVNEDVNVGYVIATVHATDADEDGNQDIRFEVDWETDVFDWFKVEPEPGNSKRGKVMVKNPLDREMITIKDNTAVYNFRVLAIDRPSNIEQPRLKGSINIVVTVLDVNDNAPVWARNYKPEIPENEGPGTWAQVLDAVDFDNDNNGNGKPISITWPDPGYVDPNFELETSPDTNQATIRNKRPFDREKTPQFLLEFELCDNPNANPQMCAIRPLVVYVRDENDNPPSDGNTYIHAYVWPELGSSVDVSTGILNREIGDVKVTDPDCCNRTTQSYEMLTTDKQTLQYFSLSNNFVTLAQATPVGTYFLKVRVTDTLFPAAVAISSIEIYVEELTHPALDNALAVRIKGLSSSEFVSRPRYNEKSVMEKFKDKVAKLLSTRGEYVEIFSITDVPVSDLPVYPQIFEPPTIDIVFAAHGSPFYQTARIYGLMAENEDYLNDGVLEIKLDDVPLNLCPGSSCTRTESCATMLTFANVPVPVLGLTNAFVGIETSAAPQCGVCESLQMVDFPPDLEVEPHPNPCYDKPCQNGGKCTPVVTKVVANKAFYSYTCSCAAEYTGPNCELATLTLKGDSYAWFDSIPLCEQTRISLQFSTTQTNGLLFYNGPITKDPSKPDFLALELFGGALKLVSDFGTGVQIAQLSRDPSHPLNDGNWHTVDIIIEKELIKLQVDMCRNSFIKEEASVSTQDYYTCYLIQSLKGRKLDVNAPLQIGGVSNQDVLDSSVTDTGFEGCVREFLVNDRILDFSDPAKASKTEEGCEAEDKFCYDDEGQPRCGQHGQCIASMYKFLYCDCDPRWEGTTCRVKSPEYTFGPSDSLIRYSVDPKGPSASTLLNQRNTEVTLSFRSTAKDLSEMILLGFHDVNDAGFIRIYIAKSILSLKHNLGGRGEEILRLPKRNVTDGQWHSVRVKRDGKRFKMELDGGGVPGTMAYSDKGTFRLLQIDPESIMIGGYISETSGTYDVTSNFQGCISDVRFNRVQLPLGKSSTLSGVNIANRTGITDGCNPDPCGTLGLPCPGSLICVAVFDTAHCACPIGTVLNNFDQCVDIPECERYRPCVHAIECRDIFGSYECVCEDDWSGKNCDEAGPAALVATARLSLAAWLIILFAFIFLILILCLFCYCSCSKRPKGLSAKDMDLDQNLGKKMVEGGGEDDADFSLENLRKPVNQVPPLTPLPMHASHQNIPNGKSPSINQSNSNLSGGPKVNPRFVASSPVPPLRGALTPTQKDDVGKYLKAKIHDLDRNAAHMGGHDTLMVYHYEGGESDPGTVSDVMSQTSEPNYDGLHQLINSSAQQGNPRAASPRKPPGHHNAPSDVV